MRFLKNKVKTHDNSKIKRACCADVVTKLSGKPKQDIFSSVTTTTPRLPSQKIRFFECTKMQNLENDATRIEVFENQVKNEHSKMKRARCTDVEKETVRQAETSCVNLHNDRKRSSSIFGKMKHLENVSDYEVFEKQVDK